MKCARCGRELDKSGKCDYCQRESEPPVRVMTPMELINYRGVTIDEAELESEYQGQRMEDFISHTQVVYQSNISWKTKLLIAALAIIAVAFLIFVALPIGAIALGLLIIFLLAKKLLGIFEKL